MLNSGTLYDKSLDVAYADNIGAKKLDAAQKLVGSRKKCAPPTNRCGNNDEAQLAHGQDGTYEEPELVNKPTDSENQPDNGIKSPNKKAAPKQRGRPKKSVTPG